MRFVQRSLMGLFLLALTVGLLALAAGSVRSTLKERWASESKVRPSRERVFAVNIRTAEAVSAAPKISVFGEIRARRSLDIRAPISGTIVELSSEFVDGGQVSKGNLLVRLDPANAQTALDVALTDKTEATAELREADAALILARDELAAAHAQVDLRMAALTRQQNLKERGVGTAAAVETAALAEASANQSVLTKRQALALAEARIARAKTTIARRDIGLNEARRRLNDTEVFAGFTGILSDVSVVEGGLVGTNEKIARLIDPEALEVAFRVSNTQFQRLASRDVGAIGGEILVRLDLWGAEMQTPGMIERVDAEVGEGQTGRQIFASLPKGAMTTFRPGDFVAVEATEPELINVVILPASAVDASGKVLVLGAEDRLEEIEVKLLRKQGDDVIVRAAALIGRDVVEARSPLLGAGIKVNPLRRGGVAEVKPKEMIALTGERRAALVEFISGNTRLPKAAKDRIMKRLNEEKVPLELVTRIEARMGG